MGEKLLTNKTLCLAYDNKRLKIIYELCNRLFQEKDECFYTKEEVKELKKDKNNIFL